MAREYKLKRDTQEKDDKTATTDIFQRYIKKDKRSINRIIKQQKIMAKAYMFLANGSEEIEALIPVDVFRRGGVEIKTVSITGSELVEMAHGVTVKADLKFEDAKLEDADLLMLPGGLQAPQTSTTTRVCAMPCSASMRRGNSLLPSVPHRWCSEAWAS